MVLIVIAVIALHRRIRALIQQQAASRHQQGLAEHPLDPTAGRADAAHIAGHHARASGAARNPRHARTDRRPNRPPRRARVDQRTGPSRAIAVTASRTPGYCEPEQSTRNHVAAMTLTGTGEVSTTTPTIHSAETTRARVADPTRRRRRPLSVACSSRAPVTMHIDPLCSARASSCAWNAAEGGRRRGRDLAGAGECRCCCLLISR